MVKQRESLLDCSLSLDPQQFLADFRSGNFPLKELSDVFGLIAQRDDIDRTENCDSIERQMSTPELIFLSYGHSHDDEDRDRRELVLHTIECSLKNLFETYELGYDVQRALHQHGPIDFSYRKFVRYLTYALWHLESAVRHVKSDPLGTTSSDSTEQ